MDPNESEIILDSFSWLQPELRFFLTQALIPAISFPAKNPAQLK